MSWEGEKDDIVCEVILKFQPYRKLPSRKQKESRRGEGVYNDREGLLKVDFRDRPLFKF